MGTFEKAIETPALSLVAKESRRILQTKRKSCYNEFSRVV